MSETHSVTADELRQFVEQIEQNDSEKEGVSERRKELLAEIKGRGYDAKIVLKVVALRKRKPDDIAEEAAILDLYRSALGMA